MTDLINNAESIKSRFRLDESIKIVDFNSFFDEYESEVISNNNEILSIFFDGEDLVGAIHGHSRGHYMYVYLRGSGMLEEEIVGFSESAKELLINIIAEHGKNIKVDEIFIHESGIGIDSLKDLITRFKPKKETGEEIVDFLLFQKTLENLGKLYVIGSDTIFGEYMKVTANRIGLTPAFCNNIEEVRKLISEEEISE